MHEDIHPDESLPYLRALGDPDRLSIVQFLRTGPQSVSDICQALSSPIANVSHHLGILKDAGIVSASKRGRFVIYALNHVVQTNDAGTQVLDFGCCRVEFGDGRSRPTVAATRPEDQALRILNQVFQRLPVPKPADETPKPKRMASSAKTSPSIEIANASFEEPATPFFDTAVAGWTKEGDPSGSGVFRNFPDDTPIPGSRQIRNADGAQLACISARNPGPRGGGASALYQELQSATYEAGAHYRLSLGVGISSVQPPIDSNGTPPAIRFALTFTDDTGRRREVIGRSVTPVDVMAGQSPDVEKTTSCPAPKQLVYFTVTAALDASPPPVCVGHRIGILITTAENTDAHGGHFVVDNASLMVSGVSSPRGKSRDHTRAPR